MFVYKDTQVNHAHTAPEPLTKTAPVIQLKSACKLFRFIIQYNIYDCV